MLKFITPLLILLCTLLDVIQIWIDRHAIELREWQVHPKFRVFQYGWRGDSMHSFARERFFLLKLPSWEWEEYVGDYGRCRYECWHQRVLMWTSTDGWQVWLQPERRHWSD